MKFIFILSVCLFISLSVFAQKNEEINKISEVGIEEISLARDDGNGKAGETTDKFMTTDIPIHCVIQLDSVKAATVKLILVAVKANGLKPETKSVSVSYTTNGKQNQVNFNASPDGIWAAGTYRADIFIDGKLAGNRTFEIEKSAEETVAEKKIMPKSFAPRKSVKKIRKN